MIDKYGYDYQPPVMAEDGGKRRKAAIEKDDETDTESCHPEQGFTWDGTKNGCGTENSLEYDEGNAADEQPDEPEEEDTDFEAGGEPRREQTGIGPVTNAVHENGMQQPLITATTQAVNPVANENEAMWTGMYSELVVFSIRHIVNLISFIFSLQRRATNATADL